MISACIVVFSLAQGIDPSLTTAIIRHESNFNPNAIGTKNEIGLMQIRPEYSKLTIKQLFDPCKNIEEGVAILARAKKYCKHKLDKTWVTCYNLGIHGASKIKYPKLFPYYKNIMANYKEF